MRSGSGLILHSGDRLAAAKADAANDLGKALGSIQLAPVPLGRFGEFEHHGERGLPREAALGLVGAQPHHGERALARVDGPDVLPALGGEGVEGKQGLTRQWAALAYFARYL